MSFKIEFGRRILQRLDFSGERFLLEGKPVHVKGIGSYKNFSFVIDTTNEEQIENDYLGSSSNIDFIEEIRKNSGKYLISGIHQILRSEQVIRKSANAFFLDEFVLNEVRRLNPENGSSYIDQVQILGQVQFYKLLRNSKTL